MLKRITAVILCAVLLFTLLPAASAAQSVTQGEIEVKLDQLIAQYNGLLFKESYNGATQCKGFADKMFALLFGVASIGPYVAGDYYYLSPLDSRVSEVCRVSYFPSDDIFTVRTQLSKALPGDYIQFRRRGRSYGHTMIVVSTDANGLTVFHSNWDIMWKNVVEYFTWERFAAAAEAFSLYHYKDYIGKTNRFTDVRAGMWYYDYALQAAELGLMNGVSTKAFGPSQVMSRGQMVTVLYRIEGEPKVSGASPFKDVKSGKYYTEPVIWASKNGIVEGVGNDRFAPSKAVTREQLAAMLYRYAVYKGYTGKQTGSLDQFTDAKAVSGYARQALIWATGSKLMNGVGGKTLAPRDTATRAQLAKIIVLFWDKFVTRKTVTVPMVPQESAQPDWTEPDAQPDWTEPDAAPTDEPADPAELTEPPAPAVTPDTPAQSPAMTVTLVDPTADPEVEPAEPTEPDASVAPEEAAPSEPRTPETSAAPTPDE